MTGNDNLYSSWMSGSRSDCTTEHVNVRNKWIDSDKSAYLVHIIRKIYSKVSA